MFIQNSIFTSLKRIYYSSISQRKIRKKSKMYNKTLEKDDKLTPQAVCFISLEHSTETHITNVCFTDSAYLLSRTLFFF